MSDFQLPLSLLIAIAGPVLALRYLRSILLQVITRLCPSSGSAEFWWRTINVLALCGSLLLMLVFGPGDDVHSANELLRRSLLLVTIAVFFSVGLVTSRIWRSAERQLAAVAPAPAVSSPQALHIPEEAR